MTTRFEGGFAGRTAVVTGGGTGMGRELVRLLVADGCDVATCDVLSDNLAETVGLCVADGSPGEVMSFVADVSDEQNVLAFRDALSPRGGPTSMCCSTMRESGAVEVSYMKKIVSHGTRPLPCVSSASTTTHALSCHYFSTPMWHTS